MYAHMPRYRRCDKPDYLWYVNPPEGLMLASRARRIIEHSLKAALFKCCTAAFRHVLYDALEYVPVNVG